MGMPHHAACDNAQRREPTSIARFAALRAADLEQHMQYLVTRDSVEYGSFGPGIVNAIFNGGQHGVAGISLLLSELQPGAGPKLHRHDYEELFILHEGQGAFTIAGTTVEARAGDIVVIPTGLPHSFINNGDGPLRVTAVHAAEAIVIDWLE
jgi:quercetin dioxygenase-like cupin family protein